MNTNNPTKPNVRYDNLVVQELPHELLIYNLKTNKAYNLNQTSALVWQNCDGTKSIGEIAQFMTKSMKQNVPDEIVWLALENLKSEGLVEFDESSTGLTRREAIRRAGLASMVALPILTMITAPAATSAQSLLAAVCQVCIKKSDGIAACTQCLNALGTCFDNAGCGGGQLFGAWTCAQCHSGFAGTQQPIPIPLTNFNGTVSWVAN